MTDDITPEIHQGSVADLGARRASRSPGLAPHAAARGPTDPVVSFDRHELREILGLYGRKVAAGEWRDYAMDFTPHKAVFSVFRRTSEAPMYRIEKDPSLGRRQGAYSVIAAGGLIMKRGHDLARVIAVLERSVKLVVS
jgi:hypothetical protein